MRNKLKLINAAIVMVLFFAVVCCGTAGTIIFSKADMSVLWWFVPIMLVLCGIAAAAFIIFYLRQQKRYEKAFDKILSSFAPEDVNALKRLSDGEPSPDQIAEWICTQTAVAYRFNDRAAVSRCFTELSRDIFWQLTDNGCRVTYSEYWKRTYGETLLDSAKDIRDLLSLPTRIELGKMVKEVLRHVGTQFSFAGVLELSPLQSVRVRIKGRSVLQEGTGEVLVAGLIRDIETRVSLSEQLAAEKIKSAFLLRTDQDMIYEVDVPENKLTSLNPQASKETFGIEDMSDFDGQRRSYWDNIHPDYREGFVDRFFNYNHMMVLPSKKMTYEYRIKDSAGEYIWVEHQVQVLSDSGGSVKKVIGRITNINETKKREAFQLFHTHTDGLTGAMLRTALSKEFENPALGDSKRCVVLFDINGFRLINNEYGFEVGDGVLMFLVTTLWENQKGLCKVGRMDNDTFAVVMLKVTENDTPRAQIDKVMRHFAAPVNIDGKMINVNLCASSSAVMGADGKFDEAMEQAEAVMKLCKKNNKTFTNASMTYDELNNQQS